MTTLEDSARGARRVYGSAHPLSKGFDYYLPKLRAALAARETKDAFRTARAKLAQERSELAQTLAEASVRPSRDA